MEYTRDSAMTALVLGFFASCWFGWAQESPPPGWRKSLVAGAVLSLLVAVAGGVTAWRHWTGPSVLDEPGAMLHYGIIVGIEFAVAGAGAVALVLAGRTDYLAPWICLVVGVHFLPMTPVLDNQALIPLGAVLVAIAIVAVVVSRRGHITASALTGAGAGVALVILAGVGAVTAVT